MPLTTGNVVFPYRVFSAVGARGFFDEGYPFHQLPPWRWTMDWLETNRAAKTMTFRPQVGNMPLRPVTGKKPDRITPVRMFPDCIWADLVHGHFLNCVGLSNPGAKFLLDTERWQRLTESFILTFMAVGDTPEERQKELEGVVALIEERRTDFKADFVFVHNKGCPNTGHDVREYWGEIDRDLEIAADLCVPQMINFPPTVPMEVALHVGGNSHCSGLWIGNTIFWNDLPIDVRVRYLGGEESPLTKRGFDKPGGYSGPLATPISINTIAEIREAGYEGFVVGGNSVRSPKDVRNFEAAGADAVFYGTGAIARPHLMRRTIAAGNRG